MFIIKFYLNMFGASLCRSSGEHTKYRLCLQLINPHKDTTALTSYGFIPLLLQCRTPYAAVHTFVLLVMGT